MKAIILLAVLGILACIANVNAGVVYDADIDDGAMMDDSSRESNENTSTEPPSTEDPASINLGEAFNTVLHAIKRVMPCGVKELHIPPMAPYRMATMYLDIDDDNLKVKGSIWDMIVMGVNNYEFVGQTYDPSNNFFTYDLIYPELSTLAEYDLKTWFLLAGIPIHNDGDGLIDVKLVDLRIVGQFAITPTESGTKITDFDIKIYLGDVIFNNWNNLWAPSVNNFVNQFQSSLIKMLSEQLRNNLSEMYNNNVLPNINEQLENITVHDLIDLMMKFSHQLNEADCMAH